MNPNRQFPLVCVWFIACLVLSAPKANADESPSAGDASATVRSGAVVDLGFEEPTGDAKDQAARGAAADVGKLSNGPKRIPSPFWAQEGKQAILLNAEQKQIVQVPDGPDVDRPNAVSASFLFLSLHPLSDEAFHGIFAKRAEQSGQNVTNYGINYLPKNDLIQLYINDGSGFRTVVYSVKDTINSRRRVHLTATWEAGDAPGTDADPDADDVRVRLYANGHAVVPKTVTTGQILGNEGWMQDINLAKLLNDVPVTIGSSTLTTEFTSAVVDEFLLFDKALSDSEASRLFLEVAGPKASDLAKAESLPVAAAQTEPVLNNTSLHGLQSGKTTRLAITGTNLAPNPRVTIPGVPLEQKLLEGTNAGRIHLEITLPENSPSGWFPLFLETDKGISKPLPIAIDTLPQRPANGTSAESPAQLPAAFSGQIAGANLVKIYFRAKTGDRIAAEVEAKRLGSAMDPVVEIKTERGTPLVIGWGETALRGDARAECKIPEEGIYFVELHDLTYRAPGQNRFRLKVGDFRSVDQWFPAKVGASEEVALKPVGVGLPADASLVVKRPEKSSEESLAPGFLAAWDAAGPTPHLPLSQAKEVLEQTPDAGLQTVEASFKTAAHVPVVINGIVSKASEEDRYVLKVTPGQKLRFSVEARKLPGPLDALLTIRNHPQGEILVYQEDSGTARDPVAEFTVPNNVQEIQVGVSDLHQRGGERFVYRLKVAPATAADFSLAVKSPSIAMPSNGTAVVEMALTRRNYGGPIRLRVTGDSSISIVPNEIPAGAENRDFFVTLVRKAEDSAQGFLGLKIIGESVGLDPALVRTANIASEGNSAALPGFATLLPVSLKNQSPFQIETPKLPPTLFVGVPAQVEVKLNRLGMESAQAVRLTLLTTEPARPNDPKDPKKGEKPKIRSAQGQAIGAGQHQGQLEIAVPLDVAAKEIDAVIKAELVPHAFSDQVAGTMYSAPFKFPIQTAATIKIDPASVTLVSAKDGVLKGTVERAAAFAEAITIELTGLPNGYQTARVTVPNGATTFEVPVKPAMESAAKTIKANLSVKLQGGGEILPAQPVELKITPAS